MKLSSEIQDSLPDDLEEELTKSGGVIYLRAVWGKRPS